MRRFYILISLIAVFLFFNSAFAQSDSDRAKIPFKVEDGYIVLPVNFSGETRFDLILDSVESYNYLSERGIQKFSDATGQDLYEMVRRSIAQKESSLSEKQVEEQMKRVYEGGRSLVLMKRMWCGDFNFSNEYFFDGHSTISSGDGMICLKAFRNIKNILLDCRDDFLVIDGPLHEGEKIPMYKIETDNLYCFYIYCEINGETKPFILSTSLSQMMVKSDTPIEKNELFLANITVGDFKQDFIAVKHDDSDFPYNFLGYPFFKDKCVQLDFENMMLYVW